MLSVCFPVHAHADVESLRTLFFVSTVQQGEVGSVGLVVPSATPAASASSGPTSHTTTAVVYVGIGVGAACLLGGVIALFILRRRRMRSVCVLSSNDRNCFRQRRLAVLSFSVVVPMFMLPPVQFSTFSPHCIEQLWRDQDWRAASQAF